MKNNHKGAQINGVPAYAHFFLFFLLCFVRLFCALAFFILFFRKVQQKQDRTQEYQKILVCLLQIFFSNFKKLFDKKITTSNAKTHNKKVES
jgi:hypothetical protein